MAPAPLSAGFQPLPPPPTIKLGPSSADSRVGGLVHALGPCGSPTNSPVRLGVSPAASTPTGVFNQRFEALFPRAGALGCAVCHQVHQLLPRRPAAALPTLLHNPPPCWGLPAPALPRVLSARLPISAPPTGLDECFFFISLVVRLPYSLIFCQFWLFFVFKLLLSFFWLFEEAQCVYLRLHLGQKFNNKDLNVSLFWHQVLLLPLGVTLCDFLWSLSFPSC